MPLVSAESGTLESNDIYIVIIPGSGRVNIELESAVFAQFGDSIYQSIMDTINKYSYVQSGFTVKAKDKGALPCTIEARVKTALMRAGVYQGEE